MKDRLFIRVEGSVETGMGHLIRCLTVAGMVSDLFEITFVGNSLFPESPCWVRTFPHDEFTEDNLRAAKWFASARGVEVRELDEQDRLVASLLL